MAEVLAFASLLVGIFAVAALLAARAREVRATARMEDLEARVGRIAAHVGIPEDTRAARSVASVLAKPSAEAVALYAAGQKIDAIRRYRAESGADLSDAKEDLERAAAVVVSGGVGSTAGPDGGKLMT